MRLVIVLAVLSREIDKYLFQPTYIVPEDSQFREAMANLAASDREKECFCRSILLSIDPGFQRKTVQSREQAVVRNVTSYLYGLLSETQYSEFHASVKDVVAKAVQVWHPIQRAKQKFETDFEPLLWGDEGWASFEFPGDTSVANRTGDDVLDGGNLLTVFPRITAVEKEGRSPYTFVVQVRSTQPQCLAAEQEMRQEPASPTVGRMTSNRSRGKHNPSNSESKATGPFLG